jgi:hypothetical protein
MRKGSDLPMRSRLVKPALAAVRAAGHDPLVVVRELGLDEASVGATDAPALALMLEGELVSSRRAHDLGLVGRVVPRSALWAHAFDTAERIAARPRRAVAALKRAVRTGSTRSLSRGLSVELVEVAGLAADPDTRAAVATYAARLERALALPEHEQPTITELAATIERELVRNHSASRARVPDQP